MRSSSGLNFRTFVVPSYDLHKVTKYLDAIMFPDDTNLFYSHKNIKTLFQIVNSEKTCK